jgi:hypothetical protein
MTQPREPTDNDDVQRVSEEVGNRLEELGIWLSGEEKPGQLARILEAVELFELAVESRGGDLMVDEGPGGQTNEPDDVHFALPQRRADESVDRYLERIERAREAVLLHPPKE